MALLIFLLSCYFKDKMILEKFLNLGRRIIPGPIFTFFQPVYHLLLNLLAVFWYQFPAKKLKVIGVTGTNGKSTVVFLISRILEKAGYSVAAISSIQFKIKDKTWPNNLKMTMPGRFKLQKFLRQAVQAGCQYVVLEVTSEGIKQHRHQFIGFDSAVLTNLTPEHLESHGGFENYKKTKAKLFKSVKPQGKIIVNLDDKSADYFMQFPAKEKIGYTLNSKPEFKLNLLGQFNISNALAAMAVAQAEGVSLEKIKLALEKIESIPGRMEIVIKEPFTVIVDYAHTPDALEKVYQTIREVFTPHHFSEKSGAGFTGRIIGVLGATGGGRDRWKRPALGKIAEQYLDKIIITNEDPYNEDPQMIIDEIAAGLKQKQPERILDRRQAIQRALKLAQEGDVVIITGKGCEPWMCVKGGKKISWDDRQVVREVYKGLSLR